MNNVLITGGNGQLGKELKDIFKNSYASKYGTLFTDINNLDITNKEIVERFVNDNKIDIIINCAAYTAVDKAEEDRVLANSVNHIAVKNLANITKEKNIKLVHISTDYVFDGTNNKPYKEDDTPNPQSVYGKTKLLGEKALLEISPQNSIIIRTSWVYSEYGNNFVKTMIKLIKEKETLNIVSDQIGTPTYAKDLASTIVKILPNLINDNVEIYHFSNEGIASWYDFTIAIKNLLDKTEKNNCIILPIPSLKYPTLAPRPYYSVLSKEKIKNKFNITIPYWKNALEDCMEKCN